MRLSSILDPDCIVLDVGSGSKGEVLARLADPIARARPDLDGAAIRTELVRRESQSSTAIADGIAIPHARPEGRDVVTASFGRAPKGLDFDSIDGQPTTLLFVLVSPASNPDAHGKWLAHVARVLGDASTRRRLLEAKTPREILDALDERERALEEPDPAARRAAPAGRR